MSGKLKTALDVSRLRQLLGDLKRERPDISFRYRLLGEMWIPNFRRVIVVNDRAVVFNDEDMNKLVMLPDLTMIMQFEIDHAFQEFEPHFHYTIESPDTKS